MTGQQSLPYLIGGLIGCVVGLLLLLIAVITGVGPLELKALSPGEETPVQTPPPRFASVEPPGVASNGDVDDDRRNAIVEATRAASPSVVSITVLNTQYVRTMLNPMELFFRQQQPGSSMVEARTYERLGSGVLVDAEGYVVTNEHLVAELKDYEIHVTLADGRHFRGELVGAAWKYDLALIKILAEGAELPVANFGDSDTVIPGEWAIAIGSPYQEILKDPVPSVTVGVISALHRDFLHTNDANPNARSYLDMIQTDASINRGNSGGALVNARGEVIGINAFIISGEGGNIGLGFAVPINRVRWVLDEIVAHGEMRPAYLGWLGRLVDPRVRSMVNLPEQLEGILITQVQQNSPATEAGLVAGDVITKINGLSMHSSENYIRMIYEARVGTEMRMEVWRGPEESFDTSLVLAELPQHMRVRSR